MIQKSNSTIMLDDISYWKKQAQISPTPENTLSLIYAYYYSGEHVQCISLIEEFSVSRTDTWSRLDVGAALLLRDNIRAFYAFVGGSKIYSTSADTILTSPLYTEIIEKYLPSSDSQEREIGEVALIRRILFQSRHGNFRELAEIYGQYISFSDDELGGSDITSNYFSLNGKLSTQLVAMLDGKDGRHYELCRIYIELERLSTIAMNLSLGYTPELDEIWESTMRDVQRILDTIIHNKYTEIQIFCIMRIHESIVDLLLDFDEKKRVLEEVIALLDTIPLMSAPYEQLCHLSYIGQHYHRRGMMLHERIDYEQTLPYYERMIAIRKNPKNNKISTAGHTLPSILTNYGFCLIKLERYTEAETIFLEVIALCEGLDDYESMVYLGMSYGNLVEIYLLQDMREKATILCKQWVIFSKSYSPSEYSIGNFILYLLSDTQDTEKEYLIELSNNTAKIDTDYFEELRLYIKKLTPEKQKNALKIIEFLIGNTSKEDTF